LPLLIAPAQYCTDNAAMIAWMGHELIRAAQDVDIRDLAVDGHPRLPLGSFVQDMLSGKEYDKAAGNMLQHVEMHGTKNDEKEIRKLKKDTKE